MRVASSKLSIGSAYALGGKGALPEGVLTGLKALSSSVWVPTIKKVVDSEAWDEVVQRGGRAILVHARIYSWDDYNNGIDINTAPLQRIATFYFADYSTVDECYSAMEKFCYDWLWNHPNSPSYTTKNLVSNIIHHAEVFHYEVTGGKWV